MSIRQDKKHIFIIGCSGIPACNGGFETFVDRLTEYRRDPNVCYHVACAVDEKPTQIDFEHNNAHCFQVKRRPLGPARTVFYDLDALNWSVKYAQEHKIEAPIFLILACRLGPFISRFINKIHVLGGVLYVNPDGQDWKRPKISVLIQRYLKIAEKQMAKHADLLICDSKAIESYIHNEYGELNPKTTYIPYGSELKRSTLSENAGEFVSWLHEKNLSSNEYYLVVARFVPENNLEAIIREFMASQTKKSLVLVTDPTEPFLTQLKDKLHFEKDNRIKFVGAVYDQELLKKIRECAFAYVHGHEVGGTNPSLLEALAATKVNLLLDVEFNREVAKESALYWTKLEGSLAHLIEDSEQLNEDQVKELDASSTNRIRQQYSWDAIVDSYETLFWKNERDC